MLYQECYFDFG